MGNATRHAQLHMEPALCTPGCCIQPDQAALSPLISRMEALPYVQRHTLAESGAATSHRGLEPGLSIDPVRPNRIWLFGASRAVQHALLHAWLQLRQVG